MQREYRNVIVAVLSVIDNANNVSLYIDVPTRQPKCVTANDSGWVNYAGTKVRTARYVCSNMELGDVIYANYISRGNIFLTGIF